MLNTVKTKAGMVHSVSGWMRGVQVKLWDPLRMRAISEHLKGVITARCYTNLRSPYRTLKLTTEMCWNKTETSQTSPEAEENLWSSSVKKAVMDGYIEPKDSTAVCSNRRDWSRRTHLTDFRKLQVQQLHLWTWCVAHIRVCQCVRV